jgi:hypothetical protein
MSKYIGLIIKEFEQENKLDLKVVSTPASDVLLRSERKLNHIISK